MIIQHIRDGKFSKVIASYLAIQLILQVAQPTAMWALTGGPKQPEFNSFTPIGTSDMVDLASGDFNYNIPIMDVGGYPLNLSYQSGVTMDQEASWVGLGWNLNVGQINRQVRGIPDDFKGDIMTYEDNLKDNVTVNVGAELDAQVFGAESGDVVSARKGVILGYNNYNGISITRSRGLSFAVSKNIQVGLDISTNASEGATVSPSVNLKAGKGKSADNALNGSLNAGISYNSNRGFTNFTLSAALSLDNFDAKAFKSDFGLEGSGNISFSSPTVTPRKRIPFTEYTGTLAVSVGPDIEGFDGEGEISASAQVQKIKTPVRFEKAYGYNFTGHASQEDIVDYNRENDQNINKTTTVLPVSNYTYDTYSIQAQGIEGQFRPYRSQVGHIYDELVRDKNDNFKLGLEIEGGSGFHVGTNFTRIKTNSFTGIWDTRAAKTFRQIREDVDRNLDYEPVYYKYVGEKKVDRDISMYKDELGGVDPVRLVIGGNKYNRYAAKQYIKKGYRSINEEGKIKDASEYSELPVFGNKKFRRKHRDIRSQSIQKISVAELKGFYVGDYSKDWKKRNSNAKSHHTAEIRVLKPDGSTYVFGEPAYNINKEETTFAIPSIEKADCLDGQVFYSGNNSIDNKSGRDHYYKNIKTPAYAHSYLLSSIYSTDYEDLSGDGPSIDDLGSYTSFEYEKKEDLYKWRVPFNKDKANYSEGLNTDKQDQKASYVYGEKEIKYIKKIVTKTHVALFDVSKRKDGRGVQDKNGGKGNSYSYKLDKIRLYSLPEAEAAKILDNDNSNDLPVEAIKTAHFEYSYDLCKGIDNGENANTGKLTLDKMYFTYRNSSMGKFTPYTFNYEGFNPRYNIKSYDIWGNYKPNDGGCGTNDQPTAPEYPFVQQSNRELQDQYASAWSLTSINLPSGGKIDLEYESDDYQSVQDKAAMQMFKVVGVGNNDNPDDNELRNNRFYGIDREGNVSDRLRDAEYVYIEIDESISKAEDFKKLYMKDIIGKPIYFRFLMNMTIHGALDSNHSKYDYVTGYFETDFSPKVFSRGTAGNKKYYAAIKTNHVDREGGVFGEVKKINPIHKAGLYFSRRYLNDQSLGLAADYGTDNVETIARKVIGTVGVLFDVFRGPNAKLRTLAYQVAKRFSPNKSWIRLSAPNDKLGGGCRIKSLVMHDQWSEMLGRNEGANRQKYTQQYGQNYDYTLEDGRSSGVATFEPNDSAENPFVEPFYNKSDNLLAPREVNYVEKPFGASFFPSSKVTYGKVTVSNLKKEGVNLHATGKVVTRHFTSSDFPTKADYTELDSRFDSNEKQVLRQLLNDFIGIPVKNIGNYYLSQGFSIHTNDMNGKMWSQHVYPEKDPNSTLEPDAISSVVYKYKTKAGSPKELDNNVTVIEKTGEIKNQQIAVDYDVVNDFRQSYSSSRTFGQKANLVLLLKPIPPFIIPVPTGLPTNISHKNSAYSAITTKVIHTTAIMEEKIATDLGSRVTTRNEAWDAETGEILLTKTVNEFNDYYYNFNLPAYWSYEQMSQASKNIGVKGVLKRINNTPEYFEFREANINRKLDYNGNRSQDKTANYLFLGDELAAKVDGVDTKLWVVGYNSSGTAVLLMNRQGTVINKENKEGVIGFPAEGDISFKVIRSGNRNQQMAKMGSLTMLKDPIRDDSSKKLKLRSNLPSSLFVKPLNNLSTNNDFNVVNASAVNYSDFWNCQCERGLPSIPLDVSNPEKLDVENVWEYKFNPYLFNVNGDWRANKSYAYLTERTNVIGVNTTVKANTRKEGFFKDYTPYYTYSNGKWSATGQSNDKWTFASQVTQYNAYGVELENQDALSRKSSAQYGYNYTLPTAVASNSGYRHMGSDNMEDYSFSTRYDPTLLAPIDTENEETSGLQDHFNFKQASIDDGATGVEVSDELAHTGFNSLLVPPDDNARFKRPLKGEPEKNLDTDGDGYNDLDDKCPYVYDNQYDYDGDGVGDACDDVALPRIVDLKTSGNQNVSVGGDCHGRRAIFTIVGKPGQVIKYQIVNHHISRRGWWAHVNGKLVARSDGGNKNFNKDLELVLDVTGRLDVEFDLNAPRKPKRGGKNRPSASFRLFHNVPKRSGEIPGTRILLSPVGFRKCHPNNNAIPRH